MLSDGGIHDLNILLGRYQTSIDETQKLIARETARLDVLRQCQVDLARRIDHLTGALDATTA